MFSRILRRSLIAVGLGLAWWSASIAASQGPISHVEGAHRPMSEIQIWQAPAFDHRAAAAQPVQKGEALQVGHPFPVDMTTSNSGDWEAPSRGDRLWRHRFTSSDALWMVFGFDRFALQPGATLYLVGQDGKHVQTYTSADVQPHGQLWTAPVPGDEVVLELHWPQELSPEEPDLHLGTVSHGYRPFGAIGRQSTDKALGSSGSCNIDVVCPEGDGWRDEIRGTVLILSNGSAACSGSLINNTSQDCANYVLTANHCFGPSSGPSLTFQFNFERPNCGSGIPATQIVTGGSSFRAESATSDFHLVELLNDIPDTFTPYYNGWSRSAAASPESVTIHHPAGDAKKISFNTDPLVSNGNYWRITEWEAGTTEGGSSGSPLFNADQLIVGQLFGGFASCSAPDEWDDYGKVSVSWDGDGASSSRLRDWLDPVNSGVVTLPGVDFASCGAGSALVTLQQSDVDDTQSGNGDGIIDSGEAVSLIVEAANNGGLDATGVSGTLTTSTAGVNIPIATANFPDIAAGASATSLAPHFLIQTEASFECGQPIDLDLTLTAAEASFPTQTPISLSTGASSIVTLFADDLEQGSANWVVESPQGSSPWALSTTDSNSPPTSWFVADAGLVNDQILLLDTFAGLAPGLELSFFHRFNTEAGFDGGVLEYQVAGGAWLDAAPLITQGGYTGVISTSYASPIGGRDAWTGSNGGWTEVRVDLASLAGNDVRVRWRMASDTSVTGEGWYVDDVALIEVTSTCTPLAPGEAAGPGSSDLLTIDYLDDRALFSLEWSEPAGGSPPAGYRLYSTPIGGPYSPACETDFNSTTLALLPVLPDNSGFLIVAFNAAGEGSYGTDSSGAQRAAASGAGVCP